MDEQHVVARGADLAHKAKVRALHGNWVRHVTTACGQRIKSAYVAWPREIRDGTYRTCVACEV